MLITLLNVLTRYFTDQSFAWTEEISVFLMVVMTLAGAAGVARRDRHIRIEFFYDGGSIARRAACACFAAAATSLTFLALTLLFGRVVADEIRWARPRWAWACRAGGSRWRSRRCCWRSPPGWTGRWASGAGGGAAEPATTRRRSEVDAGVGR